MQFDDYQKRAIESFDENVALMATAGSGKTTVLVERAGRLIEERRVDPDRILFLCFDNSAKDNMTVRMASRNSELNDVNVMTVHALAKRIVERHTDYKLVIKPYTSKTGEIGYLSIMKDIVDYHRNKALKDHPCMENLLCEFVASELRQLHSPKELTYGNFTQYFPQATLKKIFKDYLAELDRRKIITFDTSVYKAVELLEDEEILKKEQDKIDYIFVDEAQDLSYDKYIFITTLAKGKNLFMVGDTLQAIYGFAGGDCTLLRDHYKNFENVTVLNLPVNYRCSSDIINTANAVAGYTIDSQSEHYMDAIANNASYKKPVIHAEYDEVGCVVDIVKEINSYPDTAILFRTNSQMYQVVSRFFNEGIPYKCENEDKGKLPKEISILSNYFKLILDNHNNDAFKECMNQPPRYIVTNIALKAQGLSKNNSIFDGIPMMYKSRDKSTAKLMQFRNEIENITVSKFKNASFAMTKLYTLMRVPELAKRLSNGNETREFEILDLFRQFKEESAEYQSIKAYAQHFIDMIAIQNSSPRGVKLMTIHKSKGREFENVIVPFFDMGSLPHKRATDIEEEKKLLYVAITRAKKELHFVSNSMEESVFASYFEDTVDESEDEVF